MFKRTLFFSCLSLLILSLAACASEPAPEPTPTAEPLIVFEDDPGDDVQQSDVPFTIGLVLDGGTQPTESFFAYFDPIVRAPLEIEFLSAEEGIERLSAGSIDMLYADGLVGTEARLATPDSQVILIRDQDASALEEIGADLTDPALIEGRVYHFVLSSQVVVDYGVHFPQRIIEGFLSLDSENPLHQPILNLLDADAFLISDNEELAPLEALVSS